MNAAEKRRLSKEAEMQMAALKRINRWKIIALAVSAVGMGMTYAGFWGTKQNLFLGIPGIAVILIATCCAVILNLGLKNGRRNVEKILDAIG